MSASRKSGRVSREGTKSITIRAGQSESRDLENLRELLKRMPDGMVLVDRSGRIVLGDPVDDVAIRVSDERYRDLATNLPVAVFRSTPEGKILSANPAMAAIYGYDSVEDVLNTPARNFYDDPRQRDEILRRLEADGSVSGFEVRVRCRDGLVKWVATSMRAVRNERGKVRFLDGIELDITDRKLAEDELRRERDRSRLYFDIAGVIMVVIGADQKVQLINLKGCEVLGCSAEDVVGRNWFDIFVPERERERVRDAFADLMAGRLDHTEYFENPILLPNGEERLVAWHNALIRDDTGKPVATFGSGEDITERVATKRSLEESEQRLRSVLEQLPDAVAVIDQNRIVYVNATATALSGYSREELLAMKPSDAFIPEERRQVNRLITEYLSGRQGPRAAYNVTTKDGRILAIEAFSRAIRFEQKQCILTVLRDITERVQAEEDVRRSEEKYRVLYETSPDGIAVATLAGVLIDANPAYLNMLGYTSEELIGRSWRDVTPESWHDPEQEYLDAMLAGEETEMFEKEYVRKDGTILPAVIRGWLITDEKGRPDKMGVFARDITERKHSESELRRAYERLSAEVETVQRKNIALNEVMGQVEDEKKTFREQLATNLEKVFLPALLRLQESAVGPQKEQVAYLEQNLRSFAEPLGGKLSLALSRLTPRQLQICQMIKNGLSSKEMARLLGVSLGTIHKHRELIRKTLKLQKKSINLNVYLRKL